MFEFWQTELVRRHRANEASLADNAGNVSAAARQLGLLQQSLQQKVAEWGISR